MEKKNKHYLALIFVQGIIIIALFFVYMESLLSNIKNKKEPVDFQEASYVKPSIEWVDYYGPIDLSDALLYSDGTISVSTGDIPYYEGIRAFFDEQYEFAIGYFEQIPDAKLSSQIIAKIQLYEKADDALKRGHYQEIVDLLRYYETIESTDFFECELKYLLARGYALTGHKFESGKILAELVKNTEYLVIRSSDSFYTRKESYYYEGVRSLYTEVYWRNGWANIIRYYIDSDNEYDGFAFGVAGSNDENISFIECTPEGAVTGISNF